MVFWNKLREPIKKGCFNCRYERTIQKSMYEKDSKMMNNPVYPDDNWEWNGKCE